MKKSEIASLIAMARAFDDRIEEVAPPYQDPETGEVVEDARVAAWHLVLWEVDYDLAARGLTELYRSPQMMRLQPGHVYEAALKVRRRNLARVELSQLAPPDGLDEEDGTARHDQWVKAALRAVGRGLPVSEAEAAADRELKVTRRQLGPARGRPTLEAPKREARA